MKKRTLIAILGIWVALIPSLGLPSVWKHWVIVISGFTITFVALKRKYVVIEDTANMEIPFESTKGDNQESVEKNSEKNSELEKNSEKTVKKDLKKNAEKKTADTDTESLADLSSEK